MSLEETVALNAEQLAATLKCDLEHARLLRKRARTAIWQRDYRRAGRDPGKPRNFWLGYMDGPPIANDPAENRLRNNAIQGSAKLKARIEQVFGL